MSDAERLRVYLQGWDDAYRCVFKTLSEIPPEHRSYVIEHRAREVAIPHIKVVS